MLTYLKLYNNNPSLETLAQFADFYKIRFTKKYKIEDFFELNREDIFSQLNSERRQKLATELSKSVSELTSADIKIDIQLPCPCYLFIQEKYVSYSLITKHTNFQTPTTSAIAFENEQIKSIFQFKQDENENIANPKRISPGCRVIGWFKTMYFNDKSVYKNTDLDDIYNLKQTFLDLSKYVISLTTNTGASGGNFTISFPHIPLYCNSAPAEDYSQEEYQQGNIFGVNSALHRGIIPENIRSSVNTFDYFNWLIQSNDLLFISFDDMKELTDENLAGHHFDMIGLVDSVSISKNPQGNLLVDVSGRDLMKVITDDSSIYFYQGVSAGDYNILKSYDNTETVLRGGDLYGIISNMGTKDVENNNLRQLTGSLNIFACEPNDFSIDFVIKTVMSHIANMSVVPDDLFISWGNKRTTFSSLKSKEI